MKKTASRAKVIVGILAASATLASFNCLMPLLAEIQASFPEQSVSRVQMVYTLISLVAVPVMLLYGSATRVLSKKTLISIGLIALLVGGVLPVFVHGAFWVLYLSSLLIGAGTSLFAIALVLMWFAIWFLTRVCFGWVRLIHRGGVRFSRKEVPVE